MQRRGFLKSGAAGLAVATLSSCEQGSPQGALGAPPPPLTRPTGVDDQAWASVRAQFDLESGTAYMNNASLGMPPHVVSEAVCEGYRAITREPLHAKHDLQQAIAERVIPGLAAFVGAEADEITLTRNASEALYASALGVRLAPGDEVILTTQEHPAGRRPWELRAARHGIRLNPVFIPSPFASEQEVVDRIAQAITVRTRVIAFCHVTRGGHLYPVKAIAALARERGILTHVDGAQAVGMFPVDLHDLGCDTWSASLHKWLLGPVGTGVLFVRAGARAQVESVFAHDGTPEAPAYGPPGTVAFPVRAGLAAALDFANTLGTENVARRTRFLSDALKERLATLPGTRLLSGPSAETSSPGSTIFEMAGVDAIEAVPLIESAVRIHIDEHQRDDHNAIRVSTHVYNTLDEIDRLIDGLRTLMP